MDEHVARMRDETFLQNFIRKIWRNETACKMVW